LALALLLSANITNPPSQYWLSLYTYTLNLTRFAPAWNPTCAFAHLWSLSIEEQFYLVWPFAVYLLRPHALKRLIVALIVGCPLVRWLLGIYLLQSGRDAFTIGDTIYLFTLSQADAFAVGAAVAVFPQLMQLRRGMWFVRLML
jgi:peptidoglycan/LPS O-acetylase OafA/YrhL